MLPSCFHAAFISMPMLQQYPRTSNDERCSTHDNFLPLPYSYYCSIYNTGDTLFRLSQKQQLFCSVFLKEARHLFYYRDEDQKNCVISRGVFLDDWQKSITIPSDCGLQHNGSIRWYPSRRSFLKCGHERSLWCLYSDGVLRRFASPPFPGRS